jgi:50S ribosomal protein L16 3-hydroxylase
LDTDQPTPLLAGLTPAQFMRRHWQRKPLLVRGAVPGMQPVLTRSQLFRLASQETVESRAVMHNPRGKWQLQRGPFTGRSLPPVSRARWTLLVQGVDLHDERAHELLQRFAFVPQARLDDLMISWASDGGGVGPHFDSYDVFLLQVQGKRRWRIGRQKDLALREGVPLKILASFEPEEEHLLGPGDMLYLPPRWAHDGVAVGECQTYSIGFRAPSRGEVTRELLQRLADEEGEGAELLYRDPAQAATAAPGEIPPAMQQFAADAVARALRDPQALARAFGEFLTEPKPQVWFDEGGGARTSPGGVALDRRTRMMYDDRHVFINGESLRAGGRDAALMRTLANRRRLASSDLRGASAAARDAIAGWIEAGWAHAVKE